MKALRILFYTVLTLVIIALASLIIVPSFIPWNNYKEQISTFIEEQTNWQVEIEGDIALEIIPTPRLALSDISIRPAGVQTDFLTVGSAKVSLGLQELLALKANITSMTLTNVAVNMFVNSEGQSNWGQSQKLLSYLKRQNDLSPISSIDQAVIERLRIIYENAQTGQSHVFSDAEIILAGADLQKASVIARGRLNAQPASLTGTLNLTKLQEMAMDIELGLAGIEFNADGMLMDMATLPVFNGHVSLSAIRPQQELNNLKLNINLPIPMQGLDFSGRVQFDEGIAQISNAALLLNGSEIKGEMSLRQNGDENKRISITANADVFHVENFLPEGVVLTDTSVGLVPLPFLRSYNINSDISVQKLMLLERELENVKIQLENINSITSLNNLSFNIGEEGQITASGRLDAGTSARYTLNGRFTGVEFADLKAPKSVDYLTTPLAGDFDLSFSGQTLQEYQASLSGIINLSGEGGKLEGVRLEDLTQAMQLIIERDKLNAETEVESLSAKLFVENGVIRTDEFQLKTPLVNVAGTGSYNIPSQEISLRLEPTASEDIGSIVLPVKVRGVLPTPEVVPDLLTQDNLEAEAQRLRQQAQTPRTRTNQSQRAPESSTTAVPEPEPSVAEPAPSQEIDDSQTEFGGDSGLPIDLNDEENLRENVLKFLEEAEDGSSE